jgi:hypothetical protein
MHLLSTFLCTALIGNLPPQSFLFPHLFAGWLWLVHILLMPTMLLLFLYWEIPV